MVSSFEEMVIEILEITFQTNVVFGFVSKFLSKRRETVSFAVAGNVRVPITDG